jgi:hypothetical protein
MEPRGPIDPLHPAPGRPLTPFPSPEQYIPAREQEMGRMMKEILDRLTAIERRLVAIEDHLKVKHAAPIV